MEKLEPILKQKFWILLGLAIILTFVGWWVDTSSMAAVITKRTADIDTAFKNVPTGEVPNESWAKSLSVINTLQENSVKTSQSAMWKRQVANMHWPAGIEPVNGYWGKFPNEMREVFRDTYRNELTRVWKMVNPMLDDENGTGIVRYPVVITGNFPANIIGKVIRKGPWPNSAPDSESMWEAREDMWLLESLFQTITDLNGGPNATRADAVVHQIDKLELRGGGEKIKNASEGVASSAEGGFGAMGGVGMGAMGAMGPMSSGANGGASGLSAGLTSVTAEFDPIDEFGDDGLGASGGGGMGGSMSSPSMASMSAMGGFGGGEGSTAPEKKKIERYVDKGENKPFKTRGFYLSVKMDHSRIPELIEVLSSNEKSVYPIQVLRVQMVRLNEDDATYGAGSGSGGGRSPRGYPAPGAAMAMSMPMPMPMPTGAGFGAGFGAGAGTGAGGQEEGDFAELGITSRQGVEFPTSPQALASKVLLENTLRDPVMAQVTLCGYFIIYNKVEEPQQPAVGTPAEQSEPAAEPESAVEVTPGANGVETPSDGTSVDSNTTETSTNNSTESAASEEMPATGAAEADAMPDTDTEPRPESKPATPDQ